MASYQLLDQQEEDKLHKSRLLAIEEKPFKRITKRLLNPGSLISIPTQLPPTPPPDSSTDDQNAAQEALQKRQLDERRQFHDDIILDFAAFDSSISRLQFLYNSNEAERERYKAEKDRIINKAQEVKESTAELRIQLESARQTVEQGKRFDELAEKITHNRMLRPREDQEVNLRKLEEECRELERESQTYAETWKERREQFGRIVEEGMQLRRLIRDEKEEVERREGMDGGEEDGEVGENGSRGGATPKHSSQSGGATPGHENPATPRPDGGVTPRRGSSDDMPSSAQPTSPKEGVKPRSLQVDNLSRPDSRMGSRASSRASGDRQRLEPEGGEDVPMVDAEGKLKGADSPMPTVTIDEPVEEGMIDESTGEDRMDIT